MKRLLLSLFALLCSFFLFACEETANDPGGDKEHPTKAAAFLHYTLPDQKAYGEGGGTADGEAAALFSAYTLTSGITYEDGSSISGYALEQFINTNTVSLDTPDPESTLGTLDARKLYAYVIRSNNDGFENRTKFVSKGYYNADLRWDQFNQGYLLDLNYSAKSFFPASVGLVKMYNNKYAYDIYMFRKIDVKKPDAAGTLVTFEVGATADSYVDDSLYTAGTSKFTVTTVTLGSYTNVKAISLDQFLTSYVTDSPSSYTYRIVALDDTYKDGWTYGEMQLSYYLPDHDLIIQVDSSNNIVDGTKVNFPVRIEIISSTTVEYDGSANPAPAYAPYEDSN